MSDSAWVAGHLTLDEVVHPEGSVSRTTMGGAALYAAVGAAAVGRSLGLVTRRSTLLPEDLQELLADTGLRFRGRRAADPYTSESILYHADGRREFVLHEGSGTYADTTPEPEEAAPWADVRALHLAPMPVDWHRRWLRHARTLPSPVLISLDPLETEAARDPEAILDLLPLVDAFLPSAAEAALLHGGDPVQAAHDFVKAGARLCVVKLGRDGSLLTDGRRTWHLPACSVREVDPTGAGDSYCGAFLASMAVGLSPLECARAATAAASWVTEHVGALEALQRLDRDIVARRIEEVQPRETDVSLEDSGR